MYILNSFNKNFYLSLLSIIVLGTVAGLSVITLKTKFIAALLFLPVIFIFWINSTHVAKIFLTILAITFPITLQFAGKDAMTTGTVLIFLLFSQTWTALNKKNIYNNIFILKIVFLLILISIIGVLTQTPSGYYGPAIRHLINFISSVLLFLVVIKTADFPGIAKNYQEYIEKILSILIIVCSLHIFLSLLLFIFPETQYLFKIFFNRTQTFLGGQMSETGQFIRATTIFTGGEELGELLAVLFPFFLYKAFTNNKFLYLLPIFFIGLLISGTRSAAVLVVLELAVFFMMTRTKNFGEKKIIIIIGGLFLFSIGHNFIFSFFDILMSRFQDTAINIQTNKNFADILNRGSVWEGAWDTTWRTLSIFGHGPSQAHVLGVNRGYPNFHCLYLTLIFQYGMVGFLIFIFFFYSLLKNLILQSFKVSRQHSIYPLIFACILSLSAFLINEVKFEFNRSDSYQQFIWVVFAVFVLVGKILKQEKM